MGEDEPETRDTEASLELPSFGLRRRKRRNRSAEEAPSDETRVPEPGPEEPAAAAPIVDEPTVVQPAVTEPTVAEPRRQVPTGPHGYDDYDDEAPGRPTRPSTTEVAGTDAPAPRSRRRMSLPPLGGGVAALVTGLVVGLTGVLLTLAALRGCEAVGGTSSCGSAGFFLLMAVLVVMIVLGRALLDAWSVSDPGSTSFLAVGLVSVVALLFLVEVLFSWTMVIVIPAVTMAAYALSQWITTTVNDQASD